MATQTGGYLWTSGGTFLRHNRPRSVAPPRTAPAQFQDRDVYSAVDRMVGQEDATLIGLDSALREGRAQYGSLGPGASTSAFTTTNAVSRLNPPASVPQFDEQSAQLNPSAAASPAGYYPDPATQEETDRFREQYGWGQ